MANELYTNIPNNIPPPIKRCQLGVLHKRALWSTYINIVAAYAEQRDHNACKFGANGWVVSTRADDGYSRNSRGDNLCQACVASGSVVYVLLCGRKIYHYPRVAHSRDRTDELLDPRFKRCRVGVQPGDVE